MECREMYPHNPGWELLSLPAELEERDVQKNLKVGEIERERGREGGI